MKLFIYGVLATWAAFALLDLALPARRFPRVRAWRLKGTLFFLINLALSFALPMLWDGWLGEHRLLDGAALGTWGGALVGLLVVELFVYWYHRTIHRVPFLWRWHQMHHSAERVDVFGSFYFHQVDLAGFALMYSLGLVWVLGVTAEAAMIANAVITFCSIFQHANIRTPRWLGYLIQRPESHGVHHERGVHAYNYGDLPVWDMVFGTFRNPARWEGVGGFYAGGSQRVGEMLLGRDVSTSEDVQPRAALSAR